MVGRAAFRGAKLTNLPTWGGSFSLSGSPHSGTLLRLGGGRRGLSRLRSRRIPLSAPAGRGRSEPRTTVGSVPGRLHGLARSISAPLRSACCRSAPVRSAPVRMSVPLSAPRSLAPRSLAPFRTVSSIRTPVRSAPSQFTRVRFSPTEARRRLAPLRSAPIRFAPSRSTPFKRAAWRFAPARLAFARFAPASGANISILWPTPTLPQRRCRHQARREQPVAASCRSADEVRMAGTPAAPGDGLLAPGMRTSSALRQALRRWSNAMARIGHHRTSHLRRARKSMVR
jgi:hypothetical protein